MENDSKIINENTLHFSRKLFSFNKNKFKKLSNKTDTIESKKIKKDDNIISYSQENISPTIKKIRNPGIDLIRLIVMYNIVVHHIMYFSNGYNLFPNHKKRLHYIHSFIDWHNNGFILISGIVGYKTNKYSNLLYLWLLVCFYSVGIHKYFLYFEKGFVKNGDNINTEYFPVVFDKYWYFKAYFGMYLFLPVINKGIAYLTKGELKLVVMSTIGIFSIWRSYKNPNGDVFHFHNGMSLIWLLTYYLTGAYIGKYKVDYSGIKKFFYCLICIVFYFLSSDLYLKLINNEFYITIKKYKTIALPIKLKQMLSWRYDSINRIIQSLSVCLFFMQIHYNKYLAKIISFFGPLTFGVYIIHMHKFVVNKVFNHAFDNTPRNISLDALFKYIFLKAFKIFIICIFIEYLRHLFLTMLRIKKILIFLETRLKLLLN